MTILLRDVLGNLYPMEVGVGANAVRSTKGAAKEKLAMPARIQASP
jgi:hypothetical protein